MDTQDPTQSPPADSSSAERPSRNQSRRTWKGFFRDLIVYLSIYVIVAGVSIGPCFWTWFGAVYADGPKWVARFYMPLLLLCHYFPPLDWLINLWVDWWIR